MTMDPNLKERWLEALKSGRYEQTDGALRRTEQHGPTTAQVTTGYCCLGVLADVIDPDGWQRHPDEDEWKGTVGFLAELGGTLVRGLTMKSQRELAKINDESPTFGPTIAWIEANL